MPKDKTETHARIIEAAKAEFLEFGYNDASLRRIAGNAGIGVSGLYKHFASKEEMFDALVKPAMDEFYALYHKIEKEYFDGVEKIQGHENPHYEWDSVSEATRTMQFIYSRLDEFKLLILKSSGTKYEDFVHTVAELEEEVTLRFMQELKDKGYAVKEIDRTEFHLLTTAYMEAFFQPIFHGLSAEQAMHYAKTMEEFYEPAWKAWFGI